LLFADALCVFIHCSPKHAAYQRAILDGMKAFSGANQNALRSLMIDWHRRLKNKIYVGSNIMFCKKLIPYICAIQVFVIIQLH
jgi:hypothetical protein